MDNWIFPNSKKKEQAALYKLLVERKGISTDKVKECLVKYQNKYINGYKNNKTVCRFTLDCVTYHENFTQFLEIVTQETGITFKRNKSKRRKKDSYQEWYDEKNMDGSFAYNGVTDDF